MKIKKIIIVHKEVNDIHLNKDPFVYLMAFKKLGIDAILITDMNNITKKKGLPQIIDLNQKPQDIDPKDKSSYSRYIAREVSAGRKISAIVKRERPDAVMLYDNPIFFAIIKLANPSVKIIWKFDTDGRVDNLPHSKQLLKHSYYLKYKFSDLIVIASKDAYNRILKFMPVLRKKLRFIPNGIPDAFFINNYGKMERKKVILCVARIARVKGYDILLKSFSQIKKKHPDWQLRIAGPIEDHGYYKELIKLATSLKINKGVKFLGAIDEDKLINEYRSASIFCLPSYKEGAPATRVEAMAMGLPIVTTNTGGSELVKGAGIVVNSGDADSLSEALESFISNKAKRDQASRAALKIAKSMAAKVSAEKLLKEFNDA